MPLEPKVFRSARIEGKRLNTARTLAENSRKRLTNLHSKLILKQVAGRPNNRHLSEINDSFKFDLGAFFSQKGKSISLEEFLEQIYKFKKRPLRVSDIGAGRAKVMFDLKRWLSKRGIDLRTTALDVSDAPLEYYNQLRFLLSDPELDSKERERIILELENTKLNSVVRSQAESYVPNEPQDLILDFYGAFTYTKPEFRKNLLLKYAESLVKGGLALVHFEFVENKLASKNTLDPNMGGRPYVGELSDFRALEKAFEKRGFKAKFFLTQYGKYYQVNLIVQRLK